MYVDTFTVDAIGDPEPITASINCSRIIIREQGGVGNSAFTVYSSGDSDGDQSGANYPGGAQVTFERPGQALYSRNEVVGYIAMTTGSATFSKEHY